MSEYAEIKDKIAWLKEYSERHFPLEGQPSLLQHSIALIDIIEGYRKALKQCHTPNIDFISGYEARERLYKINAIQRQNLKLTEE